MSFPLRVIHVLKDIDRRSGGPSVSVPTLCRETAQFPDLEIHLLARRSQEPVELDEKDSVSVHWIGKSGKSGKSVASILEEIIATGNPETRTCLHLHGLWDPMTCRAAAFAYRGRRAGPLPVIWSIRGMLEPAAMSRKSLKKQLGWGLYQRRLLRRADRLHVTAPSETESLRRMGLGEVPVVELPNVPLLPPNLPGDTGNSPRERTLLFLGRIHPIKGLTPLLEAWSRAAPKGWKLRLTGPDPEGHLAMIQRRITELGIGDSVETTGPVAGSEKWRLLASVSCLVLPSFSENFGMVVVEALAAGTPVAATTRSPWKCLVSAEAGWQVSPDAASWATFLETLAATPEPRLREMGERSRALVRRSFSPPAIASGFREEYIRLAEGAKVGQ